MGVNRDYRNTDRCLSLVDVKAKKNRLEQKIRDKHRKSKIMYNYIKDKRGAYFSDFAEIYNHKCAYCGASYKFTDIRLFEIDHFICESEFPDNTEGRAEAGKVKNLTFSCYSCNRGKSSLHMREAYQALLNPDDNSIAQIFFRDDEYYIRIKTDYSKDELIQLFYEKLSFESESRRLDFLLLEMENLITQMQDGNKELADKLNLCKGQLLQKKNCSFI